MKDCVLQSLTMFVRISFRMNHVTISMSKGLLSLRKTKFASHKLFYLLLFFVFFLSTIIIASIVVILEDANDCSYNANNDGKWRFPILSPSSRDYKQISKLLTNSEYEVVEDIDIPKSFDDLVAEVRTKNLNLRTTILKLRGMVDVYHERTRKAQLQEIMYKHYASISIPRGIHCLSLELNMEYSSNAQARHELPSPELSLRLVDNSFYHFVVASDNVLATSVVVTSTIKNAKEPSKIVFHVITDMKTYAGMHAWFALNPISSAIIEVKGVHQFDWFTKPNVPLFKAFRTHKVLSHYHKHRSMAEHLDGSPRTLTSKLIGQSSKYISILNHLRIYLPQLFPQLSKVVFLDDDVVVQRDLSPLWDINLQGKVNGAVETCHGEYSHVMSKKFKNYLNFSNPIIASNFDPEKCAWAYGMNILDLEAWRKSNITEIYEHWVKLNLKSNLTLWRLGTLPPSLIAFDGQIHPINASWHMLGLGYHDRTNIDDVNQAAVIHYNGQAKPWLDIAIPELRGFWKHYVDNSNKFIRNCDILEP